MSSTHFTATLLRRSASGFAALAVSRAVEPVDEAGGPSGVMEAWQAHFQALVMDLAAAVDDGRQEQFAAKVRWARDAFAARGMETDLLRAGLAELGSVLEESLPGKAWAPLPEFLEAAGRELERDPAIDEARDAMDDPIGELAKAYLTAVRGGDGRRAIEGVLAAIGEGRVSTPDALDGVLMRALREIGRLWHTGVVGVAEEHFATQTTGRLLEQIVLAAPTPDPYGRTVLLTMVEGDAHDLGLRIVAAFFELDGWRTICLGANTPSADLLLSAQQFDADLLVIGATLHTHRDGVARVIEMLRKSRPDQKILVGGQGFSGLEERAREIGAHGCVLLAREAPRLGREIVEG